ncbi:hypothetical protein PLESTM_001324900 [Pleodorina starrii]|nr:hypothetical protein PLESTM_001324900 [Pleodorina starrii]
MLARPSACLALDHRTAYGRSSSVARRHRHSHRHHASAALSLPRPSPCPSSPSPPSLTLTLGACRARQPHYQRHRVVAMSFLSEALKGAKVDIESAGSDLLPRLARAARVARILGVELAAVVALAPYGAYAMSVYRRLSALPPPPPPTPPPAPAAAATLGAEPLPAAAEAAAAAATAALRQLPLGKYGVAVHRQVSYGPASRNTLDVYVPLPRQHQQQQQQQQQQGHQHQQAENQHQQQEQPQPLMPVVFFVHGGVWASGETWQYAPLATRLAQAGLVVVVPTYTLYPEALAGTMVEEVSAALSWTFNNAVRYGGDPARITAAGHSAGGHLVAWALLRRAAAAEAAAAATAATAPAKGAQAAAAAPPPPHGGNGDPQQENRQRNVYERGHVRRQYECEDEQPQGSAAHAGDARDTAAYLLGGGGASLPGAIHALRAVADAQLHPRPGVDISYDDGGGSAAAAAAAEAAAAAAAPAHAEVDVRMPALFVGMSAVYDIAKHYEFEKSRAVHELSMMKRAVGGPAGFAAASPSVILARAANAAAAAAGSSSPAADSHTHFTSFFTSFELLGDAIPARAGLNGTDDGAGAAVAGQVPLAAAPSPAFSLAAAARLPPFLVMGSCSDHMVPWHEGAELVLQLRRCGVPVRHLLYNHVGHGDFVMAWRPLDVRKEAPPASVSPPAAAAVGGGSVLHLEGLLPCARDFLRIATGRVQPFAPRSSGPSSSSSATSPTSSPLEDAAAATAAARLGELDGAMLARSRL